MKIRLVHDWKEAWKWLSTNFIALEVAWLSAWHSFEQQFTQVMGDQIPAYIAVGIAIAAFVGRIIQVQLGQKDDDVAE